MMYVFYCHLPHAPGRWPLAQTAEPTPTPFPRMLSSSAAAAAAGTGTGAGDGASGGGGYWEPHTSSIDFCEPNYVHTALIAEVHNAWSSLLGLSAVGLLGLVRGNPTGERRYVALYSVLGGVGIGSALLHSTLHRYFQGADELPMIYLVLCLAYCVMEAEEGDGDGGGGGGGGGRGDGRGGSRRRRRRRRTRHLPAALALLSLVLTAAYCASRHLYVAFLVTFAVLVVAVTAGLVRLVFVRGDRSGRGRADARRLFWTGEVWFTLIGVPVWAADMVLCRGTVLPAAMGLPGRWTGLTPHVIWHLAAGMGAYCLALSTATCRAEALGVPCRVRYALGGAVPLAAAAVSRAAPQKGE